MPQPLNRLFSHFDQLETPFLFLEERELNLPANTSHTFQNVLPKLLFILEGDLLCSLNGTQPVHCTPANVLINLENSTQTYTVPQANSPGHLRVLRLTLDPRLIHHSASGSKTLLDFCIHRFPKMGLLKKPDHTDWPLHLGTLRSHLTNNLPETKHQIHVITQKLLLDLATSNPETEIQEESELWINRIETYIESHLSEKITLDEIARSLNRSGEHLARLYRKRRNTTIFEYLRSRRLEKSKFFLLCTDWPIQKVAAASGFSTLALYSRSFHKANRVSPKEFRNQHFK
ncbi:MAG: AraC family transcriptional regulator [Verrucomicrobiota bacterium]